MPTPASVMHTSRFHWWMGRSGQLPMAGLEMSVTAYHTPSAYSVSRSIWVVSGKCFSSQLRLHCSSLP
jgi:hypothetical protein